MSLKIERIKSYSLTNISFEELEVICLGLENIKDQSDTYSESDIAKKALVIIDIVLKKDD